jgi:hypothetical protein
MAVCRITVCRATAGRRVGQRAAVMTAMMPTVVVVDHHDVAFNLMGPARVRRRRAAMAVNIQLDRVGPTGAMGHLVTGTAGKIEQVVAGMLVEGGWIGAGSVVVDQELGHIRAARRVVAMGSPVPINDVMPVVGGSLGVVRRVVRSIGRVVRGVAWMWRMADVRCVGWVVRGVARMRRMACVRRIGRVRRLRWMRRVARVR